MYGAQYPRKENGGALGIAYTLGLNSEAFTKGDLINVLTANVAEALDATTERPLGIANRTVTMASDNQTVAKVELDYTPLTDDVLFEMDFDATATVAVQGCFFTVAGATGAQVVTVASSSATVGQVYCVKFDPRGEGSVLRGLFKTGLTAVAFEPET